KRQNYSLGFDSERLTRLCGTGVPFRPLFAPIPSCNVPGVKILPTTRAQSPGRALLGTTTPNETQSIGQKFQCVKSDSPQPEENSLSISQYGIANAMRCGKKGLSLLLHCLACGQSGPSCGQYRFGRNSIEVAEAITDGFHPFFKLLISKGLFSFLVRKT